MTARGRGKGSGYASALPAQSHVFAGAAHCTFALKDLPSVRTESVGTGEERQVVIHPAKT